MFKGSLVALVTPFDGDNRVDYLSLKRLIEFHVDQGSNGLVIAGTTGESATLIPAPPDHPELEASIAARVLADMIIVPCYPGMPDAEIDREARVIKAIAQRVGSSRTRAYADAVPAPVAAPPEPETERGAEAPL